METPLPPRARRKSDPSLAGGGRLEAASQLFQVRGRGGAARVQWSGPATNRARSGGGRPKGSSGRPRRFARQGEAGVQSKRQVNAGPKRACSTLMEPGSHRGKVGIGGLATGCETTSSPPGIFRSGWQGPVIGWCSPPRCCSPHRGLRSQFGGVTTLFTPADTARNTPAVPTRSWTSGRLERHHEVTATTRRDAFQILVSNTGSHSGANVADRVGLPMVLRNVATLQERLPAVSPEPGGNYWTFIAGCEHQHRDTGAPGYQLRTEGEHRGGVGRTRSKSRTLTTTNGFSGPPTPGCERGDPERAGSQSGASTMSITRRPVGPESVATSPGRSRLLTRSLGGLFR